MNLYEMAEELIGAYEDADLDLEMPKKNKRRAKRRKQDVTKAIRKRSICNTMYGKDWYDNLHQYSKNKVHCSCNMCRFRPVWNPDAKPVSDMRKADAMDYKMDEYLTA